VLPALPDIGKEWKVAATVVVAAEADYYNYCHAPDIFGTNGVKGLNVKKQYCHVAILFTALAVLPQ